MRIKDTTLSTSLKLINNATYELAQATDTCETQLTSEQLTRLEKQIEEVSNILYRFATNLQLVNGFEVE